VLVPDSTNLNRGGLEVVKIPPDGFLTEEGQQKLVRHGHLPEREIMTGIGPVDVLETTRWIPAAPDKLNWCLQRHTPSALRSSSLASIARNSSAITSWVLPDWLSLTRFTGL
jgi:hypothetical protein